MEEITIPTGVAASLLGYNDAGELVTALKGDNEETPEPKAVQEFIVNQHGSYIKQLQKDAHDEGHGRGKKESLSSAEQALMEKYGIDTKPKDLGDLVGLIVTKHKEVEPTELTAEQIKAHEVYLQDLGKAQKRIEDLEQQYSQVQTEYERRSIRQQLESLVPQALGDKYQIPDEQQVRSNLVGLLHQLMEGDKVKLRVVDGKVVPWNTEQDTQLKDDKYQPLELGSYVQKYAPQVFTRIQPGGTPGGGSGGSGGDEGGDPPGPNNFPAIKTKDDFFKEMRRMREEKVDEKTRTAFAAEFKKREAKGEFD